MGWGSWEKRGVRDKAQGSGLRSWALWGRGVPFGWGQEGVGYLPPKRTHTEAPWGSLCRPLLSTKLRPLWVVETSPPHPHGPV